MTPKTYLGLHFKRSGVAAVAVMAGAGLAYNVTACAATPSDAVASAVTLTPSGYVSTFDLTAGATNAVLRNSRSREMKICNQTGETSPEDEASAVPPFVPSGAATLQVSYRGTTVQIPPGECARMDARQVHLTTQDPLVDGGRLQGTVRWVTPTPAGVVIVSGASPPANAQSVAAELVQIRHELQQDDRTVRRTTAELKRASHELEMAARDLRKHVAVA
jgi:hypothetical protein